MKNKAYTDGSKQKRLRRFYYSGSRFALMFGSGTLVAATMANPAISMNLYDGQSAGNNLEINLTTTVSYTGLYRVNNPSATLLGTDGDSNFKHGIVGSLFEAVPVLDVRDGNYGAHFSGQFYLNTSYLGTNNNSQPVYNNSIYVPKQNDFASGTRNVDGLNGQVLDAFVFAQHTFTGDQLVQFKLGRSVLFWGQSLFFPTDGISGGQAPINVVSAQNLINPQSQQVFMPIGQAIVTYDPVPGTTIQGYYQFEWEHDYFQGEGAYFNGTNILDKGGNFLAFSQQPFVGLTRTKDINPEHQNGQFGISLQQQTGNFDLGIYGLRFDAKAPEVGLAPFSAPGVVPGGHGAVSIGTYNLVYPRDIWLQGMSLSTTAGPFNVAGEVSIREHQPLVANNGGVFFIAPGQNANNNPGYPVGDTMDIQVSELYVSPAIPLDPGGVTVSGEAILNHLLKVTKNRAALLVGGQATAGAFDLSIIPTYNDVLPSLEVTFPTSITYNYLGRSQVDGGIYHGAGVFDVGVTGTYKVNWIASLAYQDYLGKPDPVNNALADRGYISLNLQHTF